MASVITSSGWMTSFIYKQDLTSYYMNNVMTGIIRPGVYNANIAVVISGEDVSLSIKKGTTLLFSNNYMKCGDYGIRRNFAGIDTFNYNTKDKTDSDSLVLIKCVAQNDIIQKIGTTSETLTSSNNELYVFAYFEYSKSSDDASYSVPYFRLAKVQDTVRIPSVEVKSDNFVYKTVFPTYDYNGAASLAPLSEDPSNWLLPDGCISYSVSQYARTLQNFSFLMLGVLTLLDATGQSSTATKHYYTVFTGRGLPEYRYSMINEHNAMSPSFMLNQKTGGTTSTMCKYGYLDMPDTLISDVLTKSRLIENEFEDLSWLSVYDNNYSMSVSLNTEGKYIDFNLSSEQISQINAIEYGIVFDFIFGVSSCVQNSGNSIDMLTENSSLKLQRMTLVQEININNDAQRNLLKSFDYYNDTFWYDSQSITSSNQSISVIPLDICERNISRLSSIIKNKNIWEQVANKYRVENEMDSVTNTVTDIVPIAICFRPFSRSTSSSTNVPTKCQSDIEGYNLLSYIDARDRINPMNVLSYFDLTQKKNKANVINTKSSNIYHQIPIR